MTDWQATQQKRRTWAVRFLMGFIFEKHGLFSPHMSNFYHYTLKEMNQS